MAFEAVLKRLELEKKKNTVSKRFTSVGNLAKIVFLTGLTLSISLGLQAQSNLPKYTGYTAPLPSPGAPGESFNPPMSGDAAANTPQSGEWTRTAGSDESMVITGVDFSRFSSQDEGKDTRFKVYGSSGFFKDASIQRLESNKVVITLDKNIPSWGMYLIWPGNAAGYGKPIAVNKTDSWWVGPAKAKRGTTVSVYGRNLSQYNDSTKSHVYLKSASGAGQWATVTKVNPYKVDFTVPATLQNGDYEVWTHNGHGGEYGWSGPLTLTINDGMLWTQKVFNVLDYGAKGDGINDDTQAIYRALAAAKNSAGSTVFFPQGVYMISNMLMPNSYTKWLGAGKDKTFIKCNSNFNSTDAMIYGGVNTFQVSDLTFDTNKNYRGGHSEAFFLRGSKNVTINNVVFSFAGYNVFQFDNANEIFISNSKIIGRISFLGKCSQLFIDRCDFYLTNDTENALHSWGGSNISLTNSTCQDLNNSDPNNGDGWGKGRFFCATGNFGSTRHTYIGNNSTYDLTVRNNSSVDQNSGEQFLWEGFAALWSGAVISSSTTTSNLSGFSKTLEPLKAVAVIIKGRGIGQSRRILSGSGSSITLESPWNIVPDGTSTIVVGNFADKIVMYSNNIDGKAYAAASPDHTASAGIEPYGGVINFIADRNTLSELRMGIANFATQHTAGVDPNYFNLFTNNKIVDCRWGIVNGLDLQRPSEIGLLGNTYRKNTISNAIDAAIMNWITPTAIPVMESFVYEHNEFSNVRTGFSTGSHWTGGHGISTQSFYKNRFSSSANLSAIALTQKTMVRENTFTGFDAPYSGSLAGPIAEAPHHVVEMAGVVGTPSTSQFAIWNSGITEVSWKASSNASWLKLSDTVGVIKDERSSSTISLTASALSAGSHSAELTVKIGDQVKKYTVLFTVTASAAPSIAITTPTTNSVYTTPASINIAANASDKDGSISKVEFYAGTVKLGEDLTSPYSFEWKAASAGTYALTAKATDNANLVTTSDVVNVTLNAPAVAVAPVASITSPAANISLTVPASITIEVNAGDTDGTISKVEFFAGTVKLGEDLTSPYSFEWKDVSAGTYMLTVKATDNSNLTTQSKPVELIVNNPVIACEGTGSIFWEYWTNISGNSVTAIPLNTVATKSQTLTSFSSPVNFTDNYGARARGYICPPVTGNYVFYLSADDNAELWLSTNNDPLNKTKIAYISDWASPGQYDRFPSQQSVAIRLEAGQRYYVETLHKEGNGGDHLSVGWKLPDGTLQRPIAGTNLIPYTSTEASRPAPAPIAPQITIVSPVSNSSLTAPASTTIAANATDEDGSIVKVEFFAGTTKLGEDLTAPYSFEWSNISAGSYSITAKATDNTGLFASSTEISVNVTNPVVAIAPSIAISAPASSLTAPASATISAEALDKDGTISKVEFFAGSTKLGEDLTSPYSFTWSNVAAGKYSITAKATDNANLSTTSAAIELIVNNPALACQGTGNILWEYWTNVSGKTLATFPSSTLNAKTQTLTTFSTPVNFGDNYASRVRGYICVPVSGDYTFYLASDDNAELWLSTNDQPVNKIKIAYVSDWTSPGQYNWFPSQQSSAIRLEAGTKYYIEAVHKEGDGGDHLSVGWKLPDGTLQRPIAGAHLIPFQATQITEPAPIAPQLSITSPVANSSFVAPASTTITVNASDADGSVSKVEFFAGATKLGEDLTAPYSFTWGNIAAGSYNVTAKATDNSGLTATSSAVAIVVTTPVAPQIVISSPAAISLTAPGSTTITATASDKDGSIAKVEFFAGSTKLGEDLTAPYSFTWSNIAAGKYSITAKATDNTNLSAISAAVELTVNNPTCEGTGSIFWEYWTSIYGNSVSSIPLSTIPAGSRALTTFASPVGFGDNYGARARGYICTPVSGNYTFYLASDDNSELWLSTNDQPANKVKIAYVNDWTSPGQYDRFASQQSVSIYLEANRRYYIEALHKEGNGNQDHLSVGWKLPDGTLQRPIAGKYLIPFQQVSQPLATAPLVSIISPLAGSSLTPTLSTIDVSATDKNSEIVKVELFVGSKKVGEDSTAPYSFTLDKIAEGEHAITAVATNSLGLSGTSEELKVSIDNPIVVSDNYNVAAFPNPFQQYVTIEFTAVRAENARLQIFNLQGILLANLYSGNVEPGVTYTFKFDGSKYPSGTYLSKLVCGKNVFTKLLMLAK